MIEEWKDVEGYDGLYKVSNLGRVLSLKGRGPRMLKFGPLGQKGHLLTCFYNKCVADPRSVHRLVAEHFIPNPHNLPCVMHIDDDPTNNKIDNLKWGTYSDNTRDRDAKGRRPVLEGGWKFKRDGKRGKKLA